MRNTIITTLPVILLVILAFVLVMTASLLFVSNEQLEEINNKNQAQISVLNTIISFEENNRDVTKTTLTHGKYYSFILDEEGVTVLAHPREELINTQPQIDHLIDSLTTKGIVEMMDKNGFVWDEYVYENPDTGKIEPKTAYIVKHGGYVFGAGFYHP